MSVIKNEQGKVSLTRIGIIVAGIAQGIQQAGIDILPKTNVDEKILALAVVIGLVMAGQGLRNAVGKAGK